MKNLIIDFDSTFVTVEGLEELAKIALRKNKNKDKIVAEIARITDLGMEGKISFTESLRRRIKLLGANKDHVILLSEKMKSMVTESFMENKKWIKANKEKVYIISGGFHDFIDETLHQFDILNDHVLANYFLYDKTGRISGFDEDNYLSQAGGKIKALKELGLKGETVVIGDGWTDYEMKKAGVADYFYAFTENVKREKVTKIADKVFGNFNEILEII
jgi:D-3-phosphoglycerate dehydrogenase